MLEQAVHRFEKSSSVDKLRIKSATNQSREDALFICKNMNNTVASPAVRNVLTLLRVYQLPRQALTTMAADKAVGMEMVSAVDKPLPVCRTHRQSTLFTNLAEFHAETILTEYFAFSGNKTAFP